MNSEALKNLPPEMQQRLAEIMQQQQAVGGVIPTPQAPVAPVAVEVAQASPAAASQAPKDDSKYISFC